MWTKFSHLEVASVHMGTTTGQLAQPVADLKQPVADLKPSRANLKPAQRQHHTGGRGSTAGLLRTVTQ
ncbi:hypothetical protein KKC22_04510 [Myxococcota bacterium]|nr:hypothetical protein [Myxococcota bacterium]